VETDPLRHLRGVDQLVLKNRIIPAERSKGMQNAFVSEFPMRATLEVLDSDFHLLSSKPDVRRRSTWSASRLGVVTMVGTVKDLT